MTIHEEIKIIAELFYYNLPPEEGEEIDLISVGCGNIKRILAVILLIMLKNNEVPLDDLKKMIEVAGDMGF